MPPCFYCEFIEYEIEKLKEDQLNRRKWMIFGAFLLCKCCVRANISTLHEETREEVKSESKIANRVSVYQLHRFFLKKVQSIKDKNITKETVSIKNSTRKLHQTFFFISKPFQEYLPGTPRQR